MKPIEDFSGDIECAVNVCVDGFPPVGWFGFGFFVCEFVFVSASEKFGLDDRGLLGLGKLRGVCL